MPILADFSSQLLVTTTRCVHPRQLRKQVCALGHVHALYRISCVCVHESICVFECQQISMPDMTSSQRKTHTLDICFNFVGPRQQSVELWNWATGYNQTPMTVPNRQHVCTMYLERLVQLNVKKNQILAQKCSANFTSLSLSLKKGGNVSSVLFCS